MNEENGKLKLSIRKLKHGYKEKVDLINRESSKHSFTNKLENIIKQLNKELEAKNEQIQDTHNELRKLNQQMSSLTKANKIYEKKNRKLCKEYTSLQSDLDRFHLTTLIDTFKEKVNMSANEKLEDFNYNQYPQLVGLTRHTRVLVNMKIKRNEVTFSH